MMPCFVLVFVWRPPSPVASSVQRRVSAYNLIPHTSQVVVGSVGRMFRRVLLGIALDALDASSPGVPRTAVEDVAVLCESEPGS